MTNLEIVKTDAENRAQLAEEELEEQISKYVKIVNREYERYLQHGNTAIMVEELRNSIHYITQMAENLRVYQERTYAVNMIKAMIEAESED